MTESQVRSVRFTGDNFEKAAELAKMKGQNINQFINNLVNEKVNTASFVIEKIVEYEKRFGISEQNQKMIALAMFYAKNDAGLETKGVGVFLITGDIYFEELYLELKRKLVEEFEQSMLPVIAEFERNGTQLDEKSKKIAIKYRIGKTWLESEEYKKEQQIQAEIARLGLKNDIENDHDTEWTGHGGDASGKEG